MEFLLADWMGTPLWVWLGFLGVVFVMLAIDLGVVNRKSAEIGVAASLKASAAYIAAGFAFGGWV